MLLNRLVVAAALLKNEYIRLELEDLIETAANISANRPGWGINQYNTEVNKIRNKSEVILETNLVQNLPSDILEKIESGRLSAVVPRRIAKMILTSLPAGDPSSAASSPEILLYLKQAAQVLKEIDGFLIFSNAFGVEIYKPAPENIVLELSLPRELFDNEIGPLGLKLKSFEDLLKPISEIFTGSRNEPKLLYISTSDPIFVLEWLPDAAIGLLGYYKQLLDLAKSSLNVVQSVRVLTGSGADPKTVSEIEGQLSASVARNIRSAAETVVGHSGANIDDGRAKELVNEIEIHSKIFVRDLARGARITITIAPGDAVAAAEPEENVPSKIEEAKKLIEETKTLGSQLSDLYAGAKDGIELLTGPSESAGQPTAIDV